MPPGPQAVRAARSRRPWPKTPLTPCPSPQGEGSHSPSPPAPHPLPLPETREGSHAPHTVHRLQKAGGMKAGKHSTEPKNSSWRNSLGTNIL